MMNSVPAGVRRARSSRCAGKRAAGRVRPAAVPGAARRMKRVFIPNRGEIALRIVDACRELGLESRGRRLRGRPRRAGRAAGRPRGLPRPRPGRARATCATTSSSRPRSGPAATRSTPATASCPRARELAARAREHGLIFVGPPTEVIELAGDKLAARAAGRAGRRAGAARRRGRRAPAQARGWPSEIGYPLLVKAAGGGGGRGIKLARDADELDVAAGPGPQRGRRRVRRRARLRRALIESAPPRRGPDRRRRARARSSTSASATARCSAATRR